MFKILFLDDNPARHAMMDKKFAGMADTQIIHVFDIDTFRKVLEEHDYFDKVSLDYDLNDFEARSFFLDEYATGRDACGYMVKHRNKLPAIIDIHSVNPDGAREMMEFLESRYIKCRWKMFDDSEFDDEICLGAQYEGN